MSENAEMNSAIARQMGDNVFRIHDLYWLAVCNDGERLPDTLNDDFDSDAWRDAFGEEMPKYIETDDDIAQELVDRRLFGFLARVDVQIPRAVHKSGYSTSGWGMYRQKWVYAESADGVLEKAKEVASAIIEEKLAKLRAEKSP